MESKRNISIFIDTEFESSNMITGNFLQLGFVAFYEDVEDPSDSTLNWVADTLSVSFLDQGKQKDKSVMEFWAGFQEIKERIMSEAVEINSGFLQIQNWLNNLSERFNITNFVSGISCVDFSWFRNLYLTHTDQSLTRFSLPFKSICVHTKYRTMLEFGFQKEAIDNYCKSKILRHTHYALDDALEEAYYYLRMKQLIALARK